MGVELKWECDGGRIGRLQTTSIILGSAACTLSEPHFATVCVWPASARPCHAHSPSPRCTAQRELETGMPPLSQEMGSR